jgi:hypothetical protein
MKIRNFQAIKNYEFFVPQNSLGIFKAFKFHVNLEKSERGKS